MYLDTNKDIKMLEERTGGWKITAFIDCVKLYIDCHVAEL